MEKELRDPFWRLNNLYRCKREGTGESVPFRMRPEQQQVITSLYDEPDVPLYIIKARRLGLSTGIGIAMQDHATFNAGVQAKVIERTSDYASEKMLNILRFSFESMPPEILSRYKVMRKSDSALDVKVAGLGDEFLSKTEAVLTGRGGDCSWLWISEGSIIAHRDPRRMEEIITGAWPGARLGRRMHETTWMGGKGGSLWRLVKQILEQDPDAEGKVIFFPWHNDPVCVRLDGGAIGKEHEEYFTSLGERLGRSFSQEQKRWYVVESKTQGIFMKREYPSTLDEAFSAPVEGSIYAAKIDRARVEGRIGRMPVDGNALINTSWDLGAPRNTRVWYWQIVGRWIRILTCDMGTQENIQERWARMKAGPFAGKFGDHFVPHDGEQTERSGKTMATQMRDAGMVNVRVVRRTVDEWVGINHLIGMFPTLEFDANGCREGLDDLALFHTHPETNEIVPDESCHTADGLRCMAEAHMTDMFRFKWADPELAEEWTKRDDRKGKKRRGVKSIEPGKYTMH